MAAYAVTNQWPGGFQADVTVTSIGPGASTGWTVTFTFPSGQTISQLWNASHAQSGATVTARNLSWNGNLNPGGTAAFGFLGSWASANGVPTQISCSRS